MDKILIANRGEIACRIIRSCHALGYSSIAVYSEADAAAQHVQMASESYLIGAAPIKESYLNIDIIISTALKAKAKYIHPGYGLLSENASFAAQVQEAGLIWIGPAPKTISLMADKGRARNIAVKAGVPVLPGSKPINPNNSLSLRKAAIEIGFPLLVKATGGGGGIGMRAVKSSEDLPRIAKSVSALAERTFGDSGIFLERHVANARHIEVQIFGLGNGKVFHLLNRECSIQRRFQKVIEEAPAPGIPKSIQLQMIKVACKLAENQKYSGAGTVEFILDRDTDDFFFLEMNTRIQVEHPVTEMISGQDIVALQLLLASGEDFENLSNYNFKFDGHSIECRLYAEKPEKNFLPSPGILDKFCIPDQTDSLRIDTGFIQGDTITPFYDPMIAKIIVSAPNRVRAIEEMKKALNQIEIAGISTNLAFLKKVLQHQAFHSNNINTQFIDTYKSELI
jgi:3-methylcrotonyl-CoA carboxylase alpha subunit